MSTCFDIHSSTGSYSVQIQSGIFKTLRQEQQSGFIIADDWFASNLDLPMERTLTIPALETIKSLDAIPDLIVQLRKRGVNRQTKLMALGGGIVQDVAAFIASVYMRGLQWTYVPTTVLAMADSCIGGKSSINVGPYKNLVGTFHQPQSVIIDPEFTLSLSKEQKVSGLIEAVKICYCRGVAAFEDYMALNPSSSMSVERMEKLFVCSLMAKKWFIETDEFDQGERLLLNFGHTFGHAIEGASHFKIAHGVAVAVGILCAMQMGRHLGMYYQKVPSVNRLEVHLRQLLAEVPTLQEDLKALLIPDILDRFQSDKKHRNDFYSIILIAESGNVEISRLPKDESSLQAVEWAITEGVRTI